MIRYYGRFIRASSSVLAPLTDLLQKNRNMKLSDVCKQAFNRVKSLTCDVPILRARLCADLWVRSGRYSCGSGRYPVAGGKRPGGATCNILFQESHACPEELLSGEAKVVGHIVSSSNSLKCICLSTVLSLRFILITTLCSF